MPTLTGISSMAMRQVLAILAEACRREGGPAVVLAAAAEARRRHGIEPV